MKKYESHLIKKNDSIKLALSKLSSQNTLFVLNDENKVIGSLTDGDVRRALINEFPIHADVCDVMNKEFIYFSEEKWDNEIFSRVKSLKIKLVPYLTPQKELVSIIDTTKLNSIISVDAVIMAGGKGTRLMPLTEKIPKPLLKVGKKAIIEHNVDRLISFGVRNIFISINHFGDQIINFFKANKKECNLSFIEEEKPLGTFGALGLIKKGTLKEDYLLVMNSDLITNINFERMFDQIKGGTTDLVVATVPYRVNIPYAVLETNENSVKQLTEKPTVEYECNAGIYLVKTKHINLIPNNEGVYNATDLIEDLLAKGLSVKTYLLSEYWLDVGKHNDFKKAQEDIKQINL